MDARELGGAKFTPSTASRPTGRGRTVALVGGSAFCRVSISRPCAWAILFRGSQAETIFSIGESARLARIMLANSMPECSCPFIISQAPMAIVRIWMPMRVALMVSV
jgi:hypothetical protein